ncbi:MAG: hypothetical protein M1827_000150 [Pycnora praestabilis]|nr:MAG: hypothetical protein M1827_000150 [Pycnora praestabilis]
MALHIRNNPSLSQDALPLRERLAIALPRNAHFTLYHISTPPTRCPAIFSAPQNAKPERTFCESHFCTVAITHEAQYGLLVFAIEVLIYSTASLTTLFISKADSTGFLPPCRLPKGAPSPLKIISSTFVSYLVEARQRPDIRLVVSLFARAQDQYLFPGSIEHTGKHVLDDRSLVKWWCRVLDPTARKYAAEEDGVPHRNGTVGGDTTAKGYLIIPGFDRYETESFLPPSSKSDPLDRKFWVNAHPLRQISKVPNAPPRCLIPHFPDDPKARFLDELNDEIPESGTSQPIDSPAKRRNAGQWKSVKTLEQFWETMTFRQECSSGRLVGFIWVVFTPAGIQSTQESEGGASQASTTSSALVDEDLLLTPSSAQTNGSVPFSQRPPRIIAGKEPKPPRKLTGLIKTRQPRIKVSSQSSSLNQPTQSKHYFWPEKSRGEVVLDEKEYRRINDLLLRLDFASEPVAIGSTKRWVDEVRVVARFTTGWGQIIIGKKETPVAEGTSIGDTNTLNVVRVRKKRKSESGEASDVGGSNGVESANVLSAGIIRKKPKPEPEEGRDVNILGSGLVRKKVKA